MEKHFVRGQSPFTHTVKDYPKFLPLQENINTDVVIVGGGITGALCAYYFAEKNIKTVLVEKARIASCSTSISTSLLQYELDQQLSDLKKNYDSEKILGGYEFAYKGLQELRSIIKSLQIDCEFQGRDCLTYTTDIEKIAKLKYEYEQRKTKGFDVTYIDRNSQDFIFSFEIEAGVYAHNGGAEFNPVKFTKELLSTVAKMGCNIYENTEVKGFKHAEDHVELYTSNQNIINSRKVIVATGYDISLFTNKKYCTLYTSYNIVTSPIDNITGWNKRCLIKTAEDTYTYLRTTIDNRIIIGGEDTRFIPEFLESSVAQQRYAKLQSRLDKMFPHLNYNIEYRYNGAFGATDDNLPFIGPDETHKNIWYCLGYGANGILFSTNGAKMLSNLYFGVREDDFDLVSISRK